MALLEVLVLSLYSLVGFGYCKTFDGINCSLSSVKFYFHSNVQMKVMLVPRLPYALSVTYGTANAITQFHHQLKRNREKSNIKSQSPDIKKG